MMGYDEFIEYVKEKILDWIPCSENLTVQSGTAKKSNSLDQEYLAIHDCTVEDGYSISPMISMKDAYADYIDGMPIEGILNQLANTYMQSAPPRLDIPKIREYDAIKDSIILSLVNTDANKKWLQDRPHQNMNGLSIVYKIDVGNSPLWQEAECEFNAVINIDNMLMQDYGIDQETLHKIALENTQRLYPPVFKGLFATVREKMGTPVFEFETVDEEMYVLTNEQEYLGAAAVLYPEKMEEIIGKLGDVYVIPASIHQTIIVPKNSEKGKNVKELRQMLFDVNREAVSSQEYLGNMVYEYNVQQKELKMAEGQLPVKRRTHHL